MIGTASIHLDIAGTKHTHNPLFERWPVMNLYHVFPLRYPPKTNLFLGISKQMFNLTPSLLSDKIYFSNEQNMPKRKKI